MVAGSTMSAKAAVSVRNCSCTQVNRSSRAKPLCTSSSSGQTIAGLVFWISMPVTGGPFFSASRSPVRIGPSRDWSRSRIDVSTMSMPSISVLLIGYMPVWP